MLIKFMNQFSSILRIDWWSLLMTNTIPGMKLLSALPGMKEFFFEIESQQAKIISRRKRYQE